jgi:hypothetical protein
MALGSTQPLTEMSTRNLPGGKGRQALKTDILMAIYSMIRLTFTACYKDSFTFYPTTGQYGLFLRSSLNKQYVNM